MVLRDRQVRKLRNSRHMFQIISKAKYFSTISAILVITTGILWITWGFNLGIDFTGGTEMNVSFGGELPTIVEMEATLDSIGINEPKIQTLGDNGYALRMQDITNDQRQQILDTYASKQIEEESYSNIGPSLGEELRSKAVTALALVLLAIIGYVSYAFRLVSKGPVPSWVFGVGAIVALLHDVIITAGVFIVLGHYLDVQIDSYFITALLTVLGFSVNDTIVVYDRIREKLKDRKKKSFSDIVNDSINSTLARSLNTSITTLLVLFALYLFGGESIQQFVLALMIGITAGTYSSIFIASPLLLLGQKLLKR